MSVSWTAPGGRAGDWIAVVKVGARYDDDWYGLTNGATSGTLTLTAPTQPGQYEFRYLLDGGFARSGAQQPSDGPLSASLRLPSFGSFRTLCPNCRFPDV